jgi:hypothetical protein
MLLERFRFARPWSAVLVVIATTGLVGQGRAENFQSFPTDATHNRDVILAAIANVPAGAGVVYNAESGGPDDIEVWNFGTRVYRGSFNVSATLDRIRHDDWMKDPSTEDPMRVHRNDGGFFNLRPGELTNIPRMGQDYYMEFVVWQDESHPDFDLTAGTYNPGAHPFGVNFPGPMRLLLGRGGEVYFSGDHYGQESRPPRNLADHVNPTGPGAIPEPSAFVLLGLGTFGLFAYAWRRRAA